MDDNYISEEEYQQKLDEIRERDPNLYEYIMWGNSPDEPFDYDAMEVRLLMAIKEQEEEQKQVEDEASTWEIPGKYEDDKEVESAIDWEMLETLRDEDELQQQMEQNRRDIAAIFGITLKELGVGSSNVSALQAVAEIQRHEITIELLVGNKEMEKYRYELRERAASCAAHCFHANGYAEYYDMMYRLCAEGYSLEQAIYGYKKRVGE